MAIDVETRRPRLSNITGGLSGPAIKPIALRMVYETAKAVSIPVIGMGGIVTAEDAVEFLLAGATAIQVGTASYADPRATERSNPGAKTMASTRFPASSEPSNCLTRDFFPY
jgi:dihydroorotate dehydrogenase (NAD+) catalytic subunit